MNISYLAVIILSGLLYIEPSVKYMSNHTSTDPKCVIIIYNEQKSVKFKKFLYLNDCIYSDLQNFNFDTKNIVEDFINISVYFKELQNCTILSTLHSNNQNILHHMLHRTHRIISDYSNDLVSSSTYNKLQAYNIILVVSN